ncbi:low molecular weight protein-tyrosine-phosphatase [Candidatus Protochlamydia naegleriophila]|uniref:protein-tyrosine-phosphatase n=1 Tax=Candidatus Protochlamydia naegleriophila TaxID=389348 RepID=A0A0U5CP04_9BACT|nr:low molecular weight protein-tyrosine-phosphatase [Candidatus Protochlamydia naegleriophila]CUI16428.1 low molecular weight protein-tyrosine-phosphatase [Candidatus Protochlamydia naegleriophila]
MKTVRVMFVCMGNICRSPAAEGILKHLAQNESLSLHVESCGVGDWHVGQAPDRRIQEASKARGIVLTSRAQQFQKDFFDHFDYILVADKEVLKFLYQYARTPEYKAKIALMTEFSSLYKGQDVPDPYYQPGGAFELVLDMLEESCEGLLNHIRNKEGVT